MNCGFNAYIYSISKATPCAHAQLVTALAVSYVVSICGCKYELYFYVRVRNGQTVEPQNRVP